MKRRITKVSNVDFYNKMCRCFVDFMETSLVSFARQGTPNELCRVHTCKVHDKRIKRDREDEQGRAAFKRNRVRC